MCCVGDTRLLDYGQNYETSGTHDLYCLTGWKIRESSITDNMKNTVPRSGPEPCECPPFQQGAVVLPVATGPKEGF